MMLLAIPLMISCSSDDYKAVNEIPQGIEIFANKYYPNHKVVKVKEVIFGKNKTYEVKLEDDIELKFNSNIEVIKLRAKQKLPDSVIPIKILKYVTAHYPENFIIEWELEDDYQEVELDNGIEHEFTMNGGFIRVD